MIKIITGKINSLKTTKLLKIYKKSSVGDGFIMMKKMLDNKVKSYSLKRLSTNEEYLFVVREDDIPDGFRIACQIGPYVFNQEVLEYASNVIDMLIKQKVSPIYLDEVGILELQGLGFADILIKLVASDLDLYLVIRTDILDQVIEKFHFTNYEVIQKI